MAFLKCATLLALLAVASSQYLPGGYRPPKKYMSDSALHKFLSAVRGGGRGHRELMSITGSASSPSYATISSSPGLLPPFSSGVGSPPHSVTHVPAPPKVGAFYITPPERNAPLYYGSSGGGRPHLVKISELKNARPFNGFNLITAETTNSLQGPPPQGPQGPPRGAPQPPPQTVQLYTVGGPLSSGQLASLQGLPSGLGGLPAGLVGGPQGLPSGLSGPPVQFSGGPVQYSGPQIQFSGPPGAPGGLPLGLQSIQQVSGGPGQASASNAGSLQEIIAKAAQQQHAMVIAKEQKAHPDAKITSSQILVPGTPGQQPVFVNQFGQPFLAPAIFGPGGPQQGPSGLPPQLLTSNGQRILLAPNQQQIAQQQQLSQGEVPQQLRSQGPQQQQQQLRLVSGPGGPPPGSIQLVQGPNGLRAIPFPQGGVPQQISLGNGQILNLPPGIFNGNVAIGGNPGPYIPGNAVVGQPHFALVGPQGLQVADKQLLASIRQQQQQQQQQQGKSGGDKEEQPTRQLESSSNQIEQTAEAPEVPLTNGQGTMTAAIMQSQVEFAEPITRL